MRTYLRHLRRRWIVVLLTIVAATGAAGIIDAFRPPVYEAAGRVAVSAPQGLDNEQAQATEHYILATRTAFAELAHAPELLSSAAAQLGETATPASVEDGMSTFPRQREPQLEVRVRGTDPHLARETTNAVLTQLALTIPQVAGRPVEAAVDRRAKTPTRAISPNVPLDLASGALVGLAGGMLLVRFPSRHRRNATAPADGRG